MTITMVEEETKRLYVGLPKGKLGIKVRNGIHPTTGYPTIVVSSVSEKSKLHGILFQGDTIIRLNGCRVVPSKDPHAHDDSSSRSSYETHMNESFSMPVDSHCHEHEVFQEEMDVTMDGPTGDVVSASTESTSTIHDYTEGFENMLKRMGKSRYVMIERDPTVMATPPLMVSPRSTGLSETILVKVPGADPSSDRRLGIVVRGSGNHRPSWGSGARTAIQPLWVSHVFEGSPLSGQVYVGNEITHFNGKVLLGIQPEHFAAILKDEEDGYGNEANGERVLTVEQIPEEIDLV